MKIATEVSQSLAAGDRICSHVLEIEWNISTKSFQNVFHFDFGVSPPSLHPQGTHKDVHFQCLFKRRRLKSPVVPQAGKILSKPGRVRPTDRYAVIKKEVGATNVPDLRQGREAGPSGLRTGAQPCPRPWFRGLGRRASAREGAAPFGRGPPGGFYALAERFGFVPTFFSEPAAKRRAWRWRQVGRGPPPRAVLLSGSLCGGQGQGGDLLSSRLPCQPWDQDPPSRPAPTASCHLPPPHPQWKIGVPPVS